MKRTVAVINKHIQIHTYILAFYTEFPETSREQIDFDARRREIENNCDCRRRKGECITRIRQTIIQLQGLLCPSY